MKVGDVLWPKAPYARTLWPKAPYARTWTYERLFVVAQKCNEYLLFWFVGETWHSGWYNKKIAESGSAWEVMP